MRNFRKCGTAASLLAAIAIMAVPSFAADKMGGKMMGSKMSGSKMSHGAMMSGKMSAADAAMWKKMMMKMPNADRSTLAKMSPAEKAVCMKMCKMSKM